MGDVAETGQTPLNYMLELMRREIPKNAGGLERIALENQRFEAAKAAAPYVHTHDWRQSSMEAMEVGR